MSEKRRGTTGSEAFYEHHADMCKMFSHPVRLRILNVLRTSQKSVAEIAEALQVPFGTASAHLLMMKRRRVLIFQKRGNQIFYRIADPKILTVFDLIQRILRERMVEEATLAKRAGT